MLVIGGMPVSASASPCDPCPPDCPMMQQAAKAASSANHHTGAPDKRGTSGSPCDQGMACQAAPNTMAAPIATVVAVRLTVRDATHERLNLLAPSSHPPDRSLRPPIQL
jgi:hypothetical protein